MNHRQRLKSLDGLRGLAVLMVFLFHFYPRTHWDPMGRLSAILWLGVDLFFVLSGFLITGVLYDTLGDPHFFRNFYARRALRLLPVYVAVVLCILAGSLLLGNRPTLWALPMFLYASNFVLDLQKPTGIVGVNMLHFWSLAVEEQFYFIWPTLIFLLRDRRRILSACLIGCAASLTLRWIVVSRHFAHFTPYGHLSTRLDGLLLGAALAMTLRGGPAQRLTRPQLQAGFIAGLLALALTAALGHTISLYSAPMARFGYFAADLCFAALVGLAIEPGSWANRLGVYRPLRVLGRYSYGLYLIHLLPGPLVSRIIASATAPWRPGSFPAWLVHLSIVLLYFGLCFAVAALSYHLLELPFLRLKDRFAYSDEQQAGSLRVDGEVTEPATVGAF